MKISDEAVEVARRAKAKAKTRQDGMRAALAAAVPYLMPDREALAKAIHDVDERHPWLDEGCIDHECAKSYDRYAGAVLALLNPSEVPSDQPSPGNAGSEFICASSPDGRHNTVAALDGNNEPLGYNHCGYCGVKLDW